ncbi:hypothetical protein AWE51_00205 [Aquimarina aggregata]|uniref:DUF4359 domain-containing protein n=1 Tax=Aquimarina aggregata TaxID=1642818 RepID=A0A163BYQ1_9FLAO|nr:hypothetical protein [Aquimarina aggregata]KZS41903.1 hypothetical protein AWE51_00205 [Aquimarina aggregata]
MNLLKNKRTLIIITVFIIVVITNPNNSDFKEYLIAKGNSKHYVEEFGGRTANFFLFSIFEINRERKHFKTPTVYRSIGVLNNFIVINDSREESEKVQ